VRLTILTSVRQGYASRCLPVLYSNPNLQVVRVILSHGLSPNKKRLLKRKIQKTIRIGLLGALNGIRIRDWYRDKDAEDIYKVCESLNIQILETDFINCEKSRELFREANADLGLSLGNGYIGKSVFSIPRYGMINIHTEILPQFQGAQSIIWPIYEGVQETGFTIHQIDAHIDTGEILFQRKYPIEFYPTLRETVENNLKKARSQIPTDLSYVCENYTQLKARAIKQKDGRSYTTPTFWQFLCMVKNNKIMYKKSLTKRCT
jgi:methionyl-tRNA formyltransferase